MGSLRWLLLTGALVAQGENAGGDWESLSRPRQAAFDALMPLRPSGGGISVAYRSYRDYYSDTPEAYFAIVGYLSPDSFEAEVVIPDGRSIQEQLLRLHARDQKASVDSLITRVRLKRSKLKAGECPAVERQIRLLQAAPLHVLDLATLTIHPVVHRVVVDFAGGELDATITDGENELVRWALQTLSELRRCHEPK
jgi:hypothetical protein